MIELDRRRFIFKIKEIWFSDYPYDIKGHDIVRFHACKNEVNMDGFECIESPTLLIDLTQDLDTIFKNMNKTCRNLINRAMREGILVTLSQNYEEFYKMFDRFRNKKVLSGMIEKFEIIKKYGTLFVGEFEKEMIAGGLFLEDQQAIRYWYSASKRLETDKNKQNLIGNANRLILWEAMKYAKEKGIKEFDLGGYYKGEDKNDPRYTINIFKQGFGGKLVTYYTYEKDYSRLHHFIRNLYGLKLVRMGGLLR
ncbi:MAG: hypothetical protein A2Y97_13870 [Nitrospirae bacterium RBG_13_39_12]|nr:MAG: hypothetical protein A2Y97_13870 [Nitrospirae bacterium RBG_13_39_12]